jgi:hypothetical protein
VTLAGALVFFMQAGFAMLEVGIVQPKNATNILFKNLIDASLAAITWWLVGYGVAFGKDNGNHFIGTDNYAIDRESQCHSPVVGPSHSAACHGCWSQLMQPVWACPCRRPAALRAQHFSLVCPFVCVSQSSNVRWPAPMQRVDHADGHPQTGGMKRVQ